MRELLSEQKGFSGKLWFCFKTTSDLRINIITGFMILWKISVVKKFMGKENVVNENIIS